jgi:hypothetical protein
MPAAEQPSEPQSTTTPVTTETQPANKSSYRAQMFLGFVTAGLVSLGIIWFVFINAIKSKDSHFLGRSISLSVRFAPCGLRLNRWQRTPERILLLLVPPPERGEEYSECRRLKGRNNIAQGNTLGEEPRPGDPSPERAR